MQLEKLRVFAVGFAFATLAITYFLIGTAEQEKRAASAEVASAAQSSQARMDQPEEIHCVNDLECGEFGLCDPVDHACRMLADAHVVSDPATGKQKVHVVYVLMVTNNGQQILPVCDEPPPELTVEACALLAPIDYSLSSEDNDGPCVEDAPDEDAPAQPDIDCPAELDKPAPVQPKSPALHI